jgi:hypothetical protein
MRSRNFLLIVLFWICSYNPGFAQNDAADPENARISYYGGRIHYGSMIIHSRAIKDIGTAYPIGMELTVGNHNTSQRAWNACNCYPKTGIILGFWDFDKPRILGNAFEAKAFIDPVFGAGNNVSFSIRAGTGFAWLTNPYDPATNPYNFSYSTHIAFPLLFGVSADIKLSPKLKMNLGLIYNHISNGGLREPNKGINWPTASLGIDFLPEGISFPEREISDWRKDASSRMMTSLFLFGTAKQLSHEELEKYPIFGAEIRQSYRVSRLSSLSLGLEILYDGSDREEINRQPSVDSDFKKAGLLAGHAFLLGRFTFSQALAVYLYNPYNDKDPVYQRYVLNYSFGKRLEAGVGLKAHRHVADFLDFRVGVKLF